MPVTFVFKTDFVLENSDQFSSWIQEVVRSEGCLPGNITYAFFNDEGLRDLNYKFLKVLQNWSNENNFLSFFEIIYFFLGQDILIVVSNKLIPDSNSGL